MEGTKLAVVRQLYPCVPERTLTRYALNKVQGKSKQRPGPQPVLTNEIESDLKDYIIAMQSQGYPITRESRDRAERAECREWI